MDVFVNYRFDKYVQEKIKKSRLFPSDQLGANLKCTDCHCHLSIPPVVVLKDTGEYKCGRCSLTYRDRRRYTAHPYGLTYKTAVRDLPYEELAKNLLFPCKNKNYGCEGYEEFPSEGTPTYCSHQHSGCPKFERCPFYSYGPTTCHHYTVGGSFSSLFEHCQSNHQSEICLNKLHAYTYVFSVPKNPPEIIERLLFFPSKKIMFKLFAVKIGPEFTFILKSMGTSRLFKFEIKPGAYKNNKRKGEILLSNPSIYMASPVKLVLQEGEEPEENNAFQMDFMGEVKQEKELAKVPVKDSDVLKCAKCHRYLSVKPVVATKNGFECGCCFVKTEGDKVRLKAYETLAEMVLFPCEEPGCQESFGISEMKEHRKTHRLLK